MFTLKLAHEVKDGSNGPDRPFVPFDHTLWVASVSQVKRISQDWYASPNDVTDRHGGLLVATAMDCTFTEPRLLTLLAYWVGPLFSDHESHYALVERAWLLGPNGDTIERIAP